MNDRLSRLMHIRCFLPLGAATMMLGMAMSFTVPYLPLFGVGQANLTPLKLGLFMTLIAASDVLTSAWAGKWSDKHGHHRRLLLAASIVASLGFLLLCCAQNYLTLLAIGIAFLGPGGAAMSLIFSFARTSLQFHDEAERGFALATLRMVLSMAWVFGPVVGAFVLATASFQGLFLAAAACFAICGAVIWHMCKLPDYRRDSSSADYAVDAISTLKVSSGVELPYAQAVSLPAAPASQQRVWCAIGALTLIGLAVNAMLIVLPLYVVESLKGTRFDVSIMLGLCALFEIPIMLMLGMRSSTLNKLNWLASCAAVHVVFFVAISSANTVNVLTPMLALNAFVVAVTSSFGMIYMQDLMPLTPSTATALFFNTSRIGSILSGVMSGVLIAYLGYRATFLICGCLSFGALILFAISILAERTYGSVVN